MSRFDPFRETWAEYLGPSARRALCELAYVPSSQAERVWQDIPPAFREKLISGFHLATNLGVTCAHAIKQAQEGR